MNIIIEGPDATGKSTLAEELRQRFHRPVLHSPGPSPSVGIMIDRIEAALSQTSVIFDRHPVISEFVYGTARGQHCVTVENFAKTMKGSIVIMCHPVAGADHVTKLHDTPEHLMLLERKERLIHDLYETIPRNLNYTMGITSMEAICDEIFAKLL